MEGQRVNGAKDKALHCLEHVLKRLAPVLDEERRAFVLKVLLAVAIVLAFNKKTKSSKALKPVLKLLAMRLGEFFVAFVNKPLLHEELESLFRSFIVPYCTWVTEEGEKLVTAPSMLLRFFAGWAALPMHWHLLRVKFEVNGRRATGVEVLVDSLLSSTAQKSAIAIAKEAILHLLVLADEKPKIEDEMPRVEISNVEGEVNEGTRMLLTHLDKLLRFLQRAIEGRELPEPKEEDETKSKKKAITPQSLSILNKLSEFVSDGAVGERFALSLLALVQSKKPDESTAEVLSTVARLAPRFEKPQEFVERLAPLFSKLSAKTDREALAAVALGLAENGSLMEEARERLKDAAALDSWDKTRLDEPDHDRRHATYAKLEKIWEADAPMEKPLLELFAHSHFHTLATVSGRLPDGSMLQTGDIALRSTAGTNLREMIVFAGKKMKVERTKFVDHTLLTLLLKGFKNDSEAVREECVKSLSTVLDAFPEHEQMAPLRALKNEKDPDVDFFMNFTHIQVHRRQRAIHRLVDGIRSGEIMLPVETQQRYLLPLIEPLLLNVTSKFASLSDEALRLLSVILEAAPWKRYWSVLDRFLSNLEVADDGGQKAVVRVLVIVLDAFHFSVAEDEGARTSHEGVREKMLRQVLPRLQKAVNGRGSSEIHKKALTPGTAKFANEDADIARAPVALAMVKLLQKLPLQILDQHLHGVILKLCLLLGSRSISVREVARKTLIQVAETLGAKFLLFILKEIRETLTKGYQVHVAVYTIHALVGALERDLKSGDLDPSVDLILEVLVEELFGSLAEEKEAGAKVVATVPEAKARKGLDICAQIGRFVSDAVLGRIVGPLRKVIDEKPSAKAVGEILRHVALGLKENQGIPARTQLVYAYQILSEDVKKMEYREEENREDEMTEGKRAPSCLLLPPEPKRVGVLVKSSAKSRSHVFVEFGFQLLASLLAAKRFDVASDEDAAHLDPFVDLVTRSLSTKYDQVVSNGLKSLCSLLNFRLPSLHKMDALTRLAEKLFVLLNDYSALGSAGNKTSVLQLTQLTFKAFTALIRAEASLNKSGEVKNGSTVFTEKHLEVLLAYVEGDLLDTHKQATAFSLLKAMIGRQITHPKIKELIWHLAEHSVLAQQPHIRVQCRQTVMQFVGGHPMCKKPRQFVEFFLAQIAYEYEEGRLSALEMLHSLFAEIPEKTLDEVALLAFVKLSARLVNDDSEKCRKFAAAAIRKLFETCAEMTRQDIVAATTDWLQNGKEGTRVTGAQALGILSGVEKAKKVLMDKLPALVGHFGKCLENTAVAEYSEQSLCSLLAGVTLFVKHSAEAFGETDNMKLENLIGEVARLCRAEDSWPVRAAAAALLGQLLATLGEGRVCGLKLIRDGFEKENGKPEKKGETMGMARRLAEEMCWLLRDKAMREEYVEQPVKNLVFLANCLECPEDWTWLLKRLSATCNFEIVHQPKEAVKRLGIFKLAAALVLKAEEGGRLNAVVDTFLPLLLREKNGKSAQNTEELSTLATEVLEVFESRLGEKELGRRLTACQSQALKKSDERKRKRKVELVLNPVSAARQKIKKQAAKREARKRKLDQLKPYRATKRREAEELRQKWAVEDSD